MVQIQLFCGNKQVNSRRDRDLKPGMATPLEGRNYEFKPFKLPFNLALYHIQFLQRCYRYIYIYIYIYIERERENREILATVYYTNDA